MSPILWGHVSKNRVRVWCYGFFTTLVKTVYKRQQLLFFLFKFSCANDYKVFICRKSLLVWLVVRHHFFDHAAKHITHQGATCFFVLKRRFDGLSTMCQHLRYVHFAPLALVLGRKMFETGSNLFVCRFIK